MKCLYLFKSVTIANYEMSFILKTKQMEKFDNKLKGVSKNHANNLFQDYFHKGQKK